MGQITPTGFFISDYLILRSVTLRTLKSSYRPISTTMNIYTDATKDFKVQEMGRYDEFLKSTQQNVAD